MGLWLRESTDHLDPPVSPSGPPLLPAQPFATGLLGRIQGLRLPWFRANHSAGWAGLLAVPTLMASWYGMNFKHMPELPGEHSYFAFIGVTAAVIGVVYVILKRAKWL